MLESRYGMQEGNMARNWHNRYGEPTMAPRTTSRPVETAPTLQFDLDQNHRIDQARAEGDPMAMFEAQLAQLPMEAQREIRSSLPSKGDIFLA